MKVVEIFYSLQGEGANAGKPAIFVRLAGCNQNCWFCDTNWQNGVEMSVAEILQEIEKFPAKMIIWTGGEPTLQLNNEILSHFTHYYNCIETNGTNPVPSKIDYISCSPKVDVEILQKNFVFVNEFRFPYSILTAESTENTQRKNSAFSAHSPYSLRLSCENILPKIDDLPKADNYFLSPILLGNDVFDKKNAENINSCINFIKQNPQWRLSFQTHKLLNFQ